MKDYKLPEVLKGLMKDRNLSQNMLASKLNITQRSVSEWTTFRGMPNIYSLMALANYFDVSIDYLIYGDSDK